MQKIIKEMEEFGLSASSSLSADGSVHRCSSMAKKRRNKDGWYVINQHENDFFAIFGCWVRGETRRASTRDDKNSKASEIAWEDLEIRRREEEASRRIQSKKAAKRFLNKKNFFDETINHEYLNRKGVSAHGDLRINADKIILPVIDSEGSAISYQSIDNDGNKKFMYGGVVAGGCFPIPGDDSKTICICEGYATGATVHEATGLKVLVAFNAGNMFSVAETANKKFPGKEIIICADNDTGTEERIGKNPGLEAAKKIKKKIGCRYVFPSGIRGTDFNDMSAEVGLSAVRQSILSRTNIECMGKKDCQDVDDTLIIPKDLKLEGLIGQGLEALEGDILQYSLPLVLTILSRAIAGKISVNDVWPNVFNIKVGGTSTGKTATDKRFMACLNIPEFVTMNEIASGAGLWRAIEKNPKGMCLFDEVSSLFIRNNNKGGTDMLAEGKSSALLDLYSRSGQTFKKAFGDSKNSIEINFPCVSIVGNATPTIFEAIQLRDFETGLMQRFDFWYYGGEIKKKQLVIGSKYRQKTIKWLEELKDLMDVNPPNQTLATIINENVDLEATHKAVGEIKAYSEYIVKEANKAPSDGETGFVSRRFDLSLKYALIHHAAICGASRLYEKIDENDIRWGIQIAEMISGWKSSVLTKKVVSGDFHRDCEIFKEAILLATKHGRNATFRYMSTRKAVLKNWQPKYSEMVISVLKKRGEIITKEQEKGPTIYFLPKKYTELEKDNGEMLGENNY